MAIKDTWWTVVPNEKKESKSFQYANAFLKEVYKGYGDITKNLVEKIKADLADFAAENKMRDMETYRAEQLLVAYAMRGVEIGKALGWEQKDIDVARIQSGAKERPQVYSTYAR
ncbi:MAG: hypothetical protein LBU87_03080 [Lactobacillales bacterium]|jgi:hypothetical protein|nr:hypothetical protein [Lactobacillales bacterium]